MPEPLGVASSLFLYSVIPSVPFVGYSIVVPTVLSLRPVPDGCSPHLLLYLLVSYGLSYLFLLFSFSISLFPLPGFSCFHRMEVKLLSLACLAVLQLFSLAHAALFLLLPAYAPDVLQSLIATVSSPYLPLPLPSICTSAPVFPTSLAGVAVQSFFLLWLLCTAFIAACQKHCWSGWTAAELQAIAEARARHAQWRAEREDERRKLIDGKWYRPPNAVIQQSIKPEVQADSGKQILSKPAATRLSVSSQRKEREEEKEEEEEGEEDILRYAEKMAERRRKEREEVKEQSEDVEEETEDGTEEEEEDNDGMHNECSDDDDASYSSSTSNRSSAKASGSESMSDVSASQSEQEESEEELEESKEKQEDSKRRAGRRGRRQRSEEKEHSESDREERKEAPSDQDESDEQIAAEVDDEGDRGNESERSESYKDQYGGVTAYAQAARASAAPTLPPKSSARSSAAPEPQPKAAVVEEMPLVQPDPVPQPVPQPSNAMSRTTLVRQPVNLGFGTTVPLTKGLPSLPAMPASISTQKAAELPPLPPMPLFAATAPITIPVPSLPHSSSPIQPTNNPSPSPSPPLAATFSSYTPPLPIVALPLRRPQLTPLSLHPPLPIASTVFGRTTSSSPPLPISPIPLSPKAFIAASTMSPPPLSLSSPPLVPTFSLAPPVAVSTPAAVVDGVKPPMASSALSHPPVTFSATATAALPLPSLPPHPPLSSEPDEQHRRSFVPLHSEQEVQLVAELKTVQQQRKDEQPVKTSRQMDDRKAAQDSQITQPHNAAMQPTPQQSSDQLGHHPQRLSDTGQFVVETSDSASAVRDESTVQVSSAQAAHAMQDEISFSDDEDGGEEEAQRASGGGRQAMSEQAAVIEQSVVVEEDVEEDEEMF